ncbi:MAG: NAD(P)H-dependent oxidoreductase [Candidatus Paceibacterota bacterium]|jgi:nitroreductase
MSFLENLNWRYATKKFDSTKKVSEENLQKIRDAIRLAPTSFGVQMFSVVEVTDTEIRNKIKEASYNQSQVTDSDRLFVFVARNDGEERVENMFQTMSGGNEEVRKTALAGYEGMVRNTVLSQDKASLANWSAKQSYIGLGFALAAAAELKIDSCPMEGFDPMKVKEILGLGDEFMPIAMLPVGYRDESDTHLNNPKFRFPESEIFTKV